MRPGGVVGGRKIVDGAACGRIVPVPNEIPGPVPSGVATPRRRRRPQARARAARGGAGDRGARSGAEHVDHLAREGHQDLDEVGGGGGHLLLGGVAVQDGRHLVAQDEGNGEHTLGVATETREGLRRRW